MATPEELLAVVAQVRNELTEIQKTLALEFALTEAEHQGALRVAGAPTVGRGADRGSRVRAGGNDGGGEMMTNGLKAPRASASWCCCHLLHRPRVGDRPDDRGDGGREDLGNTSTSPDLDNVSHVEWSSNNIGCPAGTMEVRTFEGDGAAPSFGETDFGGFRFSGLDQGFTFVIP